MWLHPDLLDESGENVMAGCIDGGRPHILGKKYNGEIPMWFDRTYVKNGDGYKIQKKEQIPHQTSVWLACVDACMLTWLVPVSNWRTMIRDDREFFSRKADIISRGGSDYAPYKKIKKIQ